MTQHETHLLDAVLGRGIGSEVRLDASETVHLAAKWVLDSAKTIGCLGGAIIDLAADEFRNTPH